MGLGFKGVGFKVLRFRFWGLGKIMQAVDPLTLGLFDRKPSGFDQQSSYLQSPVSRVGISLVSVLGPFLGTQVVSSSWDGRVRQTANPQP